MVLFVVKSEAPLFNAASSVLQMQMLPVHASFALCYDFFLFLSADASRVLVRNAMAVSGIDKFFASTRQ